MHINNDAYITYLIYAGKDHEILSTGNLWITFCHCQDTPDLCAETHPIFVQRHALSLSRDTTGLCAETHPVFVQIHPVSAQRHIRSLCRDTPGLGADTHGLAQRHTRSWCKDTFGLAQRHTRARSLCRDTSGLAQRHTQSLSRVRASSFFFYLTLNRRLDKMTLLQGLSCHQLHSVWYYLHYKLLPIDKRGDKFEAGQKSERMNILIPNAEE